MRHSLISPRSRFRYDSSPPRTSKFPFPAGTSTSPRHRLYFVHLSFRTANLLYRDRFLESQSLGSQLPMRLIANQMAGQATTTDGAAAGEASSILSDFTVIPSQTSPSTSNSNTIATSKMEAPQSNPAALAHCFSWADSVQDDLPAVVAAAPDFIPLAPAATTNATSTPARPRATLHVPIDGDLPPKSGEATLKRTPSAKTLLRRDSLKRREELLKGKEGSRRRQRWENDRLASNPYAQPPDPMDWAPHPVYKKKVVRYEVAQLWEHPTFRKTVVKPNEKAREEKRRHGHNDGVPKLLKDRIKKSGKGAVELLKDLEEDVRGFVQGGHMVEEAEKDGFVVVERELGGVEEKKVEVRGKKRLLQKPVLETEEADPAATFGRWLVHSIARYYGLHSWSETVGQNPAKRIAYVGIAEGQPLKKNTFRRKKGDSGGNAIECVMPKPLWAML